MAVTDKKKPSILIIDDEDEITQALMELIEAWGFSAFTAPTLPSALIKVNNQKFNIIILDIMLRKISGLKLLEQIRRNSASMNFTTPIILHSGHIDTHIFDRYKGEIDDALVKPSGTDLIKEKILYWAERRHAGPHGGRLSFVKNYTSGRFPKKQTA